MKKSLLRFLKTAGSISAVGFLILGNLASAATIKLPAQQEMTNSNPKIEELKSALQQNPNFLQYTEYMMLKYKFPSVISKASLANSYYSNDYYLKPFGKSPLSEEFSGGLAGPDNTGTYDGIDIITGGRAINESLQLGSIGSDLGDARTTANQRQLQSALELYFSDKNTYPNTLNELAPMYIGVVPAGFTYKKTAKSYELTISTATPTDSPIDISQVEALQIKSHPWESMIKNNPKIPGIFSLVPADDFVIYFRDMGKFAQLDETIKTLGKPLQSIYGLNTTTDAKEKIFNRLGIKDTQDFRGSIEEAALVSYDLDPYPNTDYALILKVKPSSQNNFASNFVSAPSDRQGKIGDYFVITTNKDLLDSISKTYQSPSSSLAQKKDAIYTLSVLESNYDGLVYFSEDFVKKMTSPAYRINARRRNTVLKTLETLQYTVFAYHDITKNWPTSLQQIADEGYIANGSIANQADYSIDTQGIVSHKDWGSLYNTTPVDQVTIASVSQAEKNLYDSFKAGYESYWREYIDPIGIAIIVGDQIKLHTVILPLIDKSEYNWLKDIAGGDGIPFSFIGNPDRIPSLQSVMKLNVDDIIYRYYTETAKYDDPDYQKCTDDYYRSQEAPQTTTITTRKSLSDTCKFVPKDKTQAVVKVKEDIAKAIDWKEKTLPLDFIDNEITLAGGENLSFNVNDLSSLDIYLGLKLKNVDLAKKFIDQVFEWQAKKQSDTGSGSGYGLFKIENNKPLKNNYNGIDYYIVPLGFTNVYYSFIGDRFYLTVSQSALNKLIDGHQKTVSHAKDAPVWSPNMLRLFDYLGEKSNVALLIDNTKLQIWLKQIIKDQWISYSGTQSIKTIQNYYAEELVLAQSLPGYDGTLSNVQNYYRYQSPSWFDAPITVTNGKVYLNTKGQQYDINNIDSGYSYYNSYNEDSLNQNTSKKIKLEDISKNFDIDKTLAEWQKLQALGIAFNLTQDGLDINIAFSNTASSAIDSRIPKTHTKPTNYYLAVVVGGAGIIVVGVGLLGWWIIKKKKTPAPQPIPPTASDVVPVPTPPENTTV